MRTLGLLFLLVNVPALAALPLGDLTQPPTNPLTPSVIARKNAQALVPEVLNALRWWEKTAKRDLHMRIYSRHIQDPYVLRGPDHDVFINAHILEGHGAYLGWYTGPVSLACLFDALIGDDADFQVSIELRGLYPQLMPKIEQARIGLPPCSQKFQAPPANLQLATHLPKPESIFEELLEYYDRAAQPAAEDLVGDFEGRCYSRDIPDQPEIQTFSGVAFTADGGPKFATPALVRMSTTVGGSIYHPTHDFDLGRLAQDESWSSGELRVKKYDRYLVLKVIAARELAGAYHPEADPDASAILTTCYAWRKSAQEQP